MSRNTGDQTLTFLEMFRSDRFADVSLAQWMGVLPPELIKAHLNLDDDVTATLPRNKPIVVAWPPVSVTPTRPDENLILVPIKGDVR
jgi:oxalate decarboxylase